MCCVWWENQRETQVEYQWQLGDYTNNRLAAHGFLYHAVPMTESQAYVPKRGRGRAPAIDAMNAGAPLWLSLS